MSLQDELEGLSDSTVAQVLAAFALYRAGRLAADTFAAIAAAAIAAANSSAAAVADLSLAATITLRTGTPAAPLGITTPLEDPARLTRSVTTILDDYDVTDAAAVVAVTRFTRLADAEPKRAGTAAYSKAVDRSRRVRGWTRGLSANACQLCRWWYRDGQVFPADRPMPTHPGCTCSQLITT